MASQIALILGASRGLGLGLAQEYLQRGWSVIGTVRGEGTKLHALAQGVGDKLEIATLDITEPSDITALRTHLGERKVDLLFVNAGVANGPGETVAGITTDEFVRVLVTNALGPLRALDALFDVVALGGTVAVMSSGLGSVANNTQGGWEVYRASKAALNTMMRSFAARHQGDSRTMIVMTPGFVRTDMGGPSATLDVATSVKGIADTLAARQGTGGVAYVSYLNKVVPW